MTDQLMDSLLCDESMNKICIEVDNSRLTKRMTDLELLTTKRLLQMENSTKNSEDQFEVHDDMLTENNNRIKDLESIKHNILERLQKIEQKVYSPFTDYSFNIQNEKSHSRFLDSLYIPSIPNGDYTLVLNSEYKVTIAKYESTIATLKDSLSQRNEEIKKLELSNRSYEQSRIKCREIIDDKEYTIIKHESMIKNLNNQLNYANEEIARLTSPI